MPTGPKFALAEPAASKSKVIPGLPTALTIFHWGSKKDKIKHLKAGEYFQDVRMFGFS